MAAALIEFVRPRGADDHAVSRCSRYLIQWSDSDFGRWYVAYHTPPAPERRKFLYSGKSEDDAKAHCRTHASKSQPQQVAAITEGV